MPTTPNNNWVPNKVAGSEWTASSSPGEGLRATCSSPAPGAKQKVVVTWIVIMTTQHTVGTLLNNGVVLVDSNGPTNLLILNISSNGATSQPISPVILCQDPLFIGSEGGTLTLDFQSAVAGWYQNIAMGGYLISDF